MSYLLDDGKNNLASFIVPIGTTNVVTVSHDFSVIPGTATTPALSISSTGASGGAANNLTLNSGVNFNFQQIIASGNNYMLSQNDYAIEIISDTYNLITLPICSKIGGRTYIISRGSNNNNLTIVCQPGDNIDTAQSINLTRKYDHVRLMANGINTWYII